MSFIISFDSCRICLKKSENSEKNMLETFVDGLGYADIFTVCTGLLLEQKSEFYPMSICDECETCMLEAYAFKKKCLRSEQVLENILNFYDEPLTLGIKTESKNVEQIQACSSTVAEEPDSGELVEEELTEQLEKTKEDVEIEVDMDDGEYENQYHHDYYVEQEQQDDGEEEIVDEANVIVEEYLIPDGAVVVEHQETYFAQEEIDDHQNILLTEEEHEIEESVASEIQDPVAYIVEEVEEEVHSYLESEEPNTSLLRKFKDYKKGQDETFQTAIDVCQQCGKLVKRRYMARHLNTHARKDTNAKEFQCDLCTSTFTLKENLQKHIRIHNNQKNYECPHCGKKFLHWSSRRYHIQCKHTLEKKYSCQYCEQRFRQGSHYKNHLKTHGLNNDNFKCPMCDKTFNSAGGLSLHLSSHSDDKNFTCTHCYKSYKTMKSLKIHTLTHTQERNYICPVCYKAFTQNHVLRTHMKAHPAYTLPPAGTITNVKAVERELRKQQMEASRSLGFIPL